MMNDADVAEFQKEARATREAVQGIEREMVRIASGFELVLSMVSNAVKEGDYEPMQEVEVIDLNGDIVKRFIAPK